MHHLRHISILNCGDGTDALAFDDQLPNNRIGLRLPLCALLSIPARLLPIKRNFKLISGLETWLDLLPDLLLRVQLSLRLALVSLEKHFFTSLSASRGCDKLDVLLLVRDCGIGVCRGWRGGSENHRSRLDAAHGDGLKVGNGDDLAVLHFLDGHKTVEAGADGAAGRERLVGGDDFRGENGLELRERSNERRVGGVAHADGRNKEGVGVGVRAAVEDMANPEIKLSW